MNALAAVAGVSLDALVGEPPAPWHPVARFGSGMLRVETALYADRRTAGVVFTAVGVGGAATVGWLLRRVLGAPLATAVATTVCVAGKMLDGEARRAADLLAAGDLAGARRQVGLLVGRRTDNLDETELSRAVVESVAENSVDAVTASLLWAAVGGAQAVLAHRAANTLDAMVGHRDARYRRFGWASARLDDLAGYLPARLTALAVAAVCPRQAGEVLTTVRHDAARHPSPNGGVVEAAYAGALGLRLGGVNRYGDVEEDRGALGSGRPPSPGDITRAIRLRRHSTAALAGAAVAVQLVVRRRRR
jgi:adenosylcobinamide-phosphate synthase